MFAQYRILLVQPWKPYWGECRSCQPFVVQTDPANLSTAAKLLVRQGNPAYFVLQDGIAGSGVCGGQIYLGLVLHLSLVCRNSFTLCHYAIMQCDYSAFEIDQALAMHFIMGTAILRILDAASLSLYHDKDLLQASSSIFTVDRIYHRVFVNLDSVS